MEQIITAALAIVTIGLAGCGSNGATVSGKVTFDGEPISEGTIAFISAEDSSSVDPIQAQIVNGDFAIEPHQALLPGNYKVAVRASRKAGQVPPEPGSTEIVDRYVQYIPVNYNSRTELAAEIAGDVENLLFELKSPPNPRGRRR